MSQFDSLIIGEVALDTNVDYDGTTVEAIGGAVFYSGCAASNMGHKIAVLPKADTTKVDLKAAFAPAPGITVYPLHSKDSIVIRNVYHTADRERRTATVASVIEPYKPSEIPAGIDAKIWHLAGLVGGDLPNELIPFAAEHAMVAIDVQCMLRWVENGGMVYHDWAEKRQYLPYVRFLKTDAAEAEILTGLTDRVAAAKVLYSWGAKEIMITHNTEVLIYDGREIYTCPIKSRNLSGRTGRGDTTFAGYINERLTHDIPTSLQTATALVSLKMEHPGPFTGNRGDVAAYVREFYGAEGE
ncbi:MAG: PfkB family carbohydrate kinase [Oscillibacter sp.]